MNRRVIVVSFFVAIVVAVFHFSYKSNSYKEVVNIYGWYGVIPKKIFKDFEKEYKIKVVYDVYDNNDSLEAKLLATNSGYDIVFPSFIPYGSRQTAMGVYSKLDSSLIPNIKNLSGAITTKFKENGGDTNYSLPIFWGTVGLAFDANITKKIFPNEKIDSYDFLLNHEKLSKIFEHGVSFPEEYIDIFPQTKVYLEIDSFEKTKYSIDKITSHFEKIRKYITKFSSNTMINDLLCGTVCMAIGSSDNAWRAMRSSKNVGKDIRYILPKDIGVLWIDCIAIPKKAHNKNNAYKFINYLLRPEVSSQITNYSGMLVNIPKATKFFNKEITSNCHIFPASSEILANLIMGTPSKSFEDVNYDKMATRAWSHIKMNKFNNWQWK